MFKQQIESTTTDYKQRSIYMYSYLGKFTSQRHGATAVIQKQEMATLTDKGGRQGPWTDVAWNLVDRPGPRDRRVLPAPSWRDGGQVATSTPHGLA